MHSVKGSKNLIEILKAILGAETFRGLRHNISVTTYRNPNI